MSVPTGSISDRRILQAARRLRFESRALETGLVVVVVASVAALASVRPSAYIPMWFASTALGLLLIERAFTIRSLRRILGRRRFSFHATDLWLVLDETSPYGEETWSFDLARPALPKPPLFWPGLLFIGFVVAQLLPLPSGIVGALNPLQVEMIKFSGDGWRPLTVSVETTRRGLAFLAAAFALHMAAGAVFDREDASRRFRVVTSRFGLVLSLVALAQWASGTRLLYGLIAPLESDGSIHTFGPFVNRNHYAGYMLMVVPLAVGLAAQAFRRYSRRVGGRANLRRLLVGLGSPEGTTLIYAQLAVLATVAALIATMSRGASLAFVGGMAVAVLATRRKARTVFLIAPVVAVALALSWAGTARIGARFGSTPSDASGRTVIWRTTLAKMRGLWYTGSGFNTFGTAVSRITAWALPKGATPWREPYETTVALAPRMGFLSPESGTGLGWFREAHNDYLQILLETGLPGLCITLAAAFALLRRTRADPWLLAAVVGVMLHSFVEFDLQIPAVATLFVTVAALRPRSRFATSSQFVSEGDSVHSHPAEYV